MVLCCWFGAGGAVGAVGAVLLAAGAAAGWCWWLLLVLCCAVGAAAGAAGGARAGLLRACLSGLFPALLVWAAALATFALTPRPPLEVVAFLLSSTFP